MNLLIYDPDLIAFLDRIRALPPLLLRRLSFRTFPQTDSKTTTSSSSPYGGSDGSRRSRGSTKRSRFSSTTTDDTTTTTGSRAGGEDQFIFINPCLLTSHQPTTTSATGSTNGGRCWVCRLESNLTSISHSLVPLLGSHYPQLLVKLYVEREDNLLSTFVINYIKGLYSQLASLLSTELGNLKVDLIIIPTCTIHPTTTNSGGMGEGGQEEYLHINSPFFTHPSTVTTNTTTVSSTAMGSGGSEEPPTNRYSQLVEAVGREGGVVNLNQLDCLITLNSNTSPSGKELYLRPSDKVIFCGTFDRLHFGHKLLLLIAFLSTLKVLEIGITSQATTTTTNSFSLLDKERSSLIEPYETRRLKVDQYLQALSKHCNTSNSSSTTTEGSSLVLDYNIIDFRLPRPDTATTHSSITASNRAADGSSPATTSISGPNTSTTTIKGSSEDGTYHQLKAVGRGLVVDYFPLHDLYGPSLEITSRYTLLLTSEVFDNGLRVNERRGELGLPPWDLVRVGLVRRATTEGIRLAKLSSSFLRP